MVQLNVTTLVHLTGLLLPRMLDRTGTESCGELIHIVPAPTSPRSESRIRHRPSHRQDAPAGAGVKAREPFDFGPSDRRGRTVTDTFRAQDAPLHARPRCFTPKQSDAHDWVLPDTMSEL